MKTSELRIGNWVIVHHNDVEIDFITNKEIVGAKGLHLTELKKVKPIKLTEKWLLKFGFLLDEEDDGYQKGKYKVSVSDEGCLFFIYIGYHPEEICEFKYVHQLQNLYFALTNEELTFKSE